MVHTLPQLVFDRPQIHITRGVLEYEAKTIALQGYFGQQVTKTRTVTPPTPPPPPTDSEEEPQPASEPYEEIHFEFERRPGLEEYRRTIGQWEFDSFRDFADSRGAHGTIRDSDIIAFWDKHNLWDLGNVVPAPQG